MSWKATAWVKELDKGITRSEKFVLLMLAEYHNTKLKAAWPSVTGLAEDCMMSKRQVQRILARLEHKGWIVRTLRCELGRGQITEYLIPALDGQRKGDKMSPIKGDKKGDISTRAIRNEPVFEPVIYPAGKCPKHPNAGSTNHGTCYKCYQESA